ncbi:MAG: iron ABC transporter permease [Slackia sp.]|nr:iron ABC transporter permease [Slackia sp.]
MKRQKACRKAKRKQEAKEQEALLDNDELAERKLDKKISPWAKTGIFVALIAIVIASFSVGKYPIAPGELIQTIVNSIFNPAAVDPQMQTALFNIRLPRILVVVMVGAALAAAGAAYQGMFRNPLVSPDLLGASAGASLGACLALVLDLPSTGVQLFAFAGGMIAVGCVVWLNRVIRYDELLGLVLGGILVSTLFQSGVSLLKFLADSNDKLPEITFWLMGGFSRVDQNDLFAIIIPMFAGFGVLMLERWKLNALSFGEEEARSLGINVSRVRLVVIFASTLIVSVSVAVSGVVGWVGLVIPHLARAIVGPNYRALIPASMFIGASYLLLVDDLCRMLLSLEIPIGILTAIIGVPFFIVIFKHNMKGW